MINISQPDNDNERCQQNDDTNISFRDLVILPCSRNQTLGNAGPHRLRQLKVRRRRVVRWVVHEGGSVSKHVLVPFRLKPTSKKTPVF